nr:MAG TPA: hypothetical protein [Caudoviricetes sp.]
MPGVFCCRSRAAGSARAAVVLGAPGGRASSWSSSWRS